MELITRDKKIIWHPFTQEKTAGMPIAISRAKGSYIYDENNKPYLDLISSWWVNLHGHGHPDIAKAIYKQSLTLEHVIFAGFTHEPAVLLCENLNKITPKELSRYFFSDNGSTSVEVALKMACQYWYNHGKQERSIFLSFEGGYHGDTFGAMSVGAKSGFHDPFSKLLFKVMTIPFPDTYDNDQDIIAKENNAIKALEQILETHGHKCAAIILEPLMQGASGMRMCRPEFVKKVIDNIRKFGILVIFDEVMTGFGRTGTNFALEQIDANPDFLCVSKGITGGFLPLALTITTEKIYQSFLGDTFKQAFAHGHSYTANPIACAAAITSFELLEKDSTKQSISNINQMHKKGMALIKRHSPKIKNIRVLGTIAAFDINAHTNINASLKIAFLNSGLLIRPLGNTIYLLPPYSIKPQELIESYEKIDKVINSLEF